MLPLLTNPYALFALLALPALPAIYWLRSRFRRYPVSSLMLWVDHKEARAGGTRIQRLQTPLLFFLELLVLILLVLASAGPHVLSSQGNRPLVVVLDDSYSMLAGGVESPRNQAIAALEEELAARPRSALRFVLAGDRPQSLGDAVHTVAEARALVAEWKCRAPSAHLEEAVALASEIGGDRFLILVLTDHAPPAEPEKGRVQWWAFGSACPNLAFVNASRTGRDGPERCLLEIANLSPTPQSTTLRIETGTPPVELPHARLTLEPNETRRVILELKEGTPALDAYLETDSLEIDNRVTLVPAVVKSVRMDVQIKNPALRTLIEKAVRATRGTLRDAGRPDLLITDREGVQTARVETWLVQVVAEKEAEAYAGPFVLDRAHPLTEGLSLQGVIWGSGKTKEFPGTPVITAGDVPLLTDADSLAGRHEIRLRLRPDLSTLQDTPDWPILVWNLVRWRAGQMPGLARSNVRLGEEIVLNLATDSATIEMTGPDRKTRRLPVENKRAVARPDDVGSYELRADQGKYAFALNALSQEESDLGPSTSGRWGDWLDDVSLRLDYRSIDWTLLLVVFAALTVHMVLVGK